MLNVLWKARFMSISPAISPAQKNTIGGPPNRAQYWFMMSRYGRITVSKIVETPVLLLTAFHHQSINRIGDGLQSVAFASDGVIEALEHPDKRFIFGVQWHPEWLQDQQPMRAIYHEFVRACLEENGTHR